MSVKNATDIKQHLALLQTSGALDGLEHWRVITEQGVHDPATAGVLVPHQVPVGVPGSRPPNCDRAGSVAPAVELAAHGAPKGDRRGAVQMRATPSGSR